MSKLTDKLTKDLEFNYSNLGWTGSFQDFMQMLSENPHKHTRTAFQYINDMIQSFGSYHVENCGDHLTRYKIFDDPFDKGEHAVYGLDRKLMNLVANMRTISEGGGKERIMVLHGPVATAKTSIIRLLSKGLEEYSKTDEGTVYTFNWVFTNETSSSIPGFRLPHQDHKNEESYAKLSEDEIIGNIPCQLNDNPLLLLPKKERREVLESLVDNSEEKFLIPKKILEGEPCFNCQSIYNFLLKKYNGDINKVLKHIQIERVTISEINKIGLATVQPAQNTDGQAPMIFWENSRYANVASLLKGLKIHQFEGKWADANRGLIHLTEMFHKNPVYLSHLLSAVEEHMVDFNGIQGFIDCLIMGTTNQEAYLGFEQNPTNKGLKSRLRKIDIGYVLKPREEAKIYQKEFEEAGYKAIKENEDDGHMFPHVLDMLSLWSVMSRLEKPEEKHFRNRGFSFNKQGIVEIISPLVKARLYDGELHESLSLEEKKMLSDKSLQKLIRNEFSDEGMRGISPRTMQNLITDIISRKELEEAKCGSKKHCLSIFRVWKGIENLLKSDKDVWESNNDPDEGYRSLENNLELVKEEYDMLIKNEIKDSVIGFNHNRLENLMQDYLKNIKAHINDESIFNKVTQRYEKPNEKKMEMVEDKLGLDKSNREEFRKNLLRDMGSRAIAAGKDLSFRTTNMELFKQLEEGMFENKKKKLKMDNMQLEDAINKFGTKRFEKFEPEQQKIITFTLDNMIKEFNYCKHCAKDVFKYVLKEGIIDFKGGE